MKIAGKKTLSIILSLMMVFGVIAVGGGNIKADAATFADLNQSSVWIKQSQSGPCVLDACAMMIRRTLIGTGNTNWSSVTESSLKGTACQSGSWSVYYTFDYMGVSVRHTSFDSTASSLKSILDSHPEGIVLFSRSKGHAVLVTDYSGDTFYCADPAYGDKRNLNSANQGVSYSNSSEYWYVSSPTITLTPDDTTPPTLSNLRIVEQNINGYKLECSVSDNIGVTSVRFATWTTTVVNGTDQDDLKWQDGTISNGKASIWIYRSDHNNEFGTYVTDVYVYDAAQLFVKDRITVTFENDTAGPSFSHIKVTNVTSSGYTISCTVTDNTGVTSVSFATWTKNNGLDDLYWKGGTISGNTVTCRIKYSEHNNETGSYYTVIKAYDNSDNSTTYSAVTVCPSRIGNISEGKYIIQLVLNEESVIEVENKSSESGANIQLGSFEVNSSQIFEIKKNGAGYTISPLCSGLNMDAWGAVPGEGVNVAQGAVNNDINQTWQFEPIGGGYLIISCMGSGDLNGIEYAVDTYDYGGTPGTNIQLSEANYANTQFYRLLPVGSIYFDDNGGGYGPTSQYTVDGKAITLTANHPVRDGYIFMGWSTDKYATIADYVPGGTYNINSGTTLYAIWLLNKNPAKGDINGDGSVNIVDLVRINSYVNGASDFTAYEKKAADLNNDGVVDESDLDEMRILSIYKISVITYYANGVDSTPEGLREKTGTSVNLTASIPQRTGYTFLGWSKKAGATTAQYQPGASYTLNSDTVFYAVWKKNADTYTLTYNANGGSGAPTSQTGNGKITISSFKPSRDGYTFKKWNTKADGTGTSYNPGATYNLTANATLYAIWEQNPVTPTTYVLTYEVNGGTGKPESQTGNGNILLSIIQPQKDGYTFKCWNTKSDGSGTSYNPGATYNLTANATLYAIWEQNSVTPTTYTLTYNANGGSGAPAKQTGSGSIVLSTKEPSRSGYIFKGWSKSSTSTSAQYLPGDTFNLTANTTLYAVWAGVPLTSYTLTYNANGGTGAPDSQSGNGNITLSSGTPSRKSYTFKSWNTKSDGTGTNYAPGATFKLSADTTLYAIWEKNDVTPSTYTLYYNANGGTGAPESQSGNGYITLSSGTPSRNNYTFKSWNTKSDGTGTNYAPGTTFKLSADTTLYAVWEKNDTPDNPSNPDNPSGTPSISIRNYRPSLSLSYRSTVVFRAEFNNAPEGSEVHWFYNGKDGLTSERCTIKNCDESFTIQAKLISRDGKVLAESEKESVSVSTGFFARLIAFFRALFGTLPVIEQ